MSTLEVLQTCPTQQNKFLSVLGALDPENNNIIAFKLDDFKSRLSHQLAFQLSTKAIGKIICCIVLDEGTSNSFMSLSCWRDIVSPEINRSPTTLKAFYGHGFKIYGLLPSLQVELGEKLVSIPIEVVDTTIDYSLLIGRNWFYSMQSVASYVF